MSQKLKKKIRVPRKLKKYYREIGFLNLMRVKLPLIKQIFEYRDNSDLTSLLTSSIRKPL